ncbi:unnamed protein product [Penicillium salamii]|uniref:Uncharacterized protein n=1 Tax=Penicillium salamii TaxID=1612424 RepID=A0A9W4N2Z8_9EURO|nr:unnamed protein product [Penicillium salamii]
MPECNFSHGAHALFVKSSGLSSQELLKSSRGASTSESHVPKVTSILQYIMQSSTPIAQSRILPQTSSLETVIETPTTAGETATDVKGYSKVDDELRSSGIVPQDSQSSRSSLLSKDLFDVEIAKPMSDDPNLLQYTGSSVDSENDFAKSFESVVPIPSGQATSYQAPQVTMMNTLSSMGGFQNHSDQIIEGYIDKDTFLGGPHAVSWSETTEVGAFKTTLHSFESSDQFQPAQATHHTSKSSDLDLSTPSSITQSQLIDSTDTVSTTAMKTAVEKLTKSNSRTSRVVGLISGSVFGGIFLFAMIFYLHQFYRRIGKSIKSSGLATEPKSENTAVANPDAPEIPEISRFSAYS